VPQQSNAPSTWALHKAQLEQLETWQLRASIAANSADDGWNARIHWQQSPKAFSLNIFGPLGQGAVLLEGDITGVRLHTGKEVLSADDPKTLLKQQANIDLPVEHLSYWTRGLPVPELNIQSQSFTPDGYLARLKQADWVIDFTAYQTVKDYTLPRKMRLENAEYLVKIALSSWQLDLDDD
jgi:outer membrane lipoprotein LolB